MTCLYCYLAETLWYLSWNKEQFMNVLGDIKGFSKGA